MLFYSSKKIMLENKTFIWHTKIFLPRSASDPNDQLHQFSGPMLGFAPKTHISMRHPQKMDPLFNNNDSLVSNPEEIRVSDWWEASKIITLDPRPNLLLFPKKSSEKSSVLTPKVLPCLDLLYVFINPIPLQGIYTYSFGHCVCDLATKSLVAWWFSHSDSARGIRWPEPITAKEGQGRYVLLMGFGFP